MQDKQLELTFPCDWQYRIVGKDEAQIKVAVENCMGAKEYKITPSKQSSSGKFLSFNVDALVFNHEERIALYELLKKEQAILYVL